MLEEIWLWTISSRLPPLADMALTPETVEPRGRTDEPLSEESAERETGEAKASAAVCGAGPDLRVGGWGRFWWILQGCLHDNVGRSGGGRVGWGGWCWRKAATCVRGGGRWGCGSVSAPVGPGLPSAKPGSCMSGGR